MRFFLIQILNNGSGLLTQVERAQVSTMLATRELLVSAGEAVLFGSDVKSQLCQVVDAVNGLGVECSIAVPNSVDLLNDVLDLIRSKKNLSCVMYSAQKGGEVSTMKGAKILRKPRATKVERPIDDANAALITAIGEKVPHEDLPEVDLMHKEAYKALISYYSDQEWLIKAQALVKQAFESCGSEYFRNANRCKDVAAELLRSNDVRLFPASTDSTFGWKKNVHFFLVTLAKQLRNNGEKKNNRRNKRGEKKTAESSSSAEPVAQQPEVAQQVVEVAQQPQVAFTPSSLSFPPAVAQALPTSPVYQTPQQYAPQQFGQQYAPQQFVPQQFGQQYAPQQQ